MLWVGHWESGAAVEPGRRTTTIAHLSDVHLAPLVGFGWRYANVKRLLGYANWLRKRQYDHLRPVVDRLVADLHRQAVDHIAVTGDLVNIGLPAEYRAALAWLEALGPPSRVSVVPGNHDIYTRLDDDPGTERWRSYMVSDAAGAGIGGPDGFPYLRRVNDVVLIGVNSAVPTAPADASGFVGATQRAALGRLLARLKDEAVCRVVLIHHPPLVGQARPGRWLRDAAQLEEVLAREGAELVIHGHNHQNTIAWRDWQGHPLPVVGIGSASIGRLGHEPLGRYNLYSIERAGPDWRIGLVGRGPAAPDGPVVDVQRTVLRVPAR